MTFVEEGLTISHVQLWESLLYVNSTTPTPTHLFMRRHTYILALITSQM